MSYSQQKNMEPQNKNTLTSMFIGILSDIKNISFRKTTAIIKDISTVCELSYNSYENSRIKNNLNMHPIIPTRGEIYNAIITEGVGKELCGNHLVIIIQNANSNMYSDKVSVIPIEGDGHYIKKSYQMRLKNSDLESGHIDKDPSRIIFSDIMTIDKARLNRKIGKLTEDKMNKIDGALRKHLSL